MALEKTVAIEQLEIILGSETPCVQVRQTTRVMEDGVELSKSYHRWSISPGDDLTVQEPLVRALCEIVFATP